MPTETIIASYNDLKFIQGVTPVNQTNWQEYFGSALPTGIYSGFDQLSLTGTANDSAIDAIADGTVFVNGVMAKVETADGYTTITKNVSLDDRDRFILLRVYPVAGIAQLIEMKAISTGQYDDTISTELRKFIESESYNCTRNAECYDIPIFYQGNFASASFLGVDLRRMIDLSGKRKVGERSSIWSRRNSSGNKILVSGKNSYNIPASILGDIHIYLDPVNVPDGAVITAPGLRKIIFHQFPGINGVLASNSPELNYGVQSYFGNFIEAVGTYWTLNGSNYEYYDPDSNTTQYFNIEYRGKYQTAVPYGNVINYFSIRKRQTGVETEWGLISGSIANQNDLTTAIGAKADATSVYTKTEVDNLLDLKADVSEVYTKTDVYTKTETNALYPTKSTVYTKTETDELLAGKASINDIGKTVIYVRTSGDDTTGDGTYALPYGTIQHAIDVASKYGIVTIDIGAGTYSRIKIENKDIIFNISSSTVEISDMIPGGGSTSENPITIKNGSLTVVGDLTIRNRINSNRTCIVLYNSTFNFLQKYGVPETRTLTIYGYKLGVYAVESSKFTVGRYCVVNFSASLGVGIEMGVYLDSNSYAYINNCSGQVASAFDVRGSLLMYKDFGATQPSGYPFIYTDAGGRVVTAVQDGTRQSYVTWPV